jgi:hypothetical protein
MQDDKSPDPIPHTIVSYCAGVIDIYNTINRLIHSENKNILVYLKNTLAYYNASFLVVNAAVV